MLVYNQEHTAVRMTDQPAQELLEYRHRKTPPKDHEGQLAPIGYRRDGVAAKTLTGARDDRRLSPPTVGASCLVVRAQPHLVTPVNYGPQLLGLPADGRVLAAQPATHRLRVPLEGPPQRLLRRQVPSLEVAPHRPHRDPNPKLPLQKHLNRLPSPQGKGQPQLIGTSADNTAHRRGRLIRRQARNRRPTTPLSPQRPDAFPLPQLHPAVHCPSGHPEDLGGFRLLHALFQRLYNPPTKVFLCHCRKRTSILYHHA